MISECAGIRFKSDDTYDINEGPFPIREYEYRDPFNGYFSYFYIKVIDCVNPPPYDPKTMTI